MEIDHSVIQAADALEARTRAHRAEMARRSERRDSARELGTLLREQIGLPALHATYEEYRENKSAWLEDEDAWIDGA